jgi:hypothetical protein
MTDIARYNLTVEHPAHEAMDCVPDGDWVRWSDVQAQLSEAQAELQSALEANRMQSEVIVEAQAKVAEMQQIARDAYEVYAGSEGVIPLTAPEAYLQYKLNEMAEEIARALPQPPQETPDGE